MKIKFVTILPFSQRKLWINKYANDQSSLSE